MLYSEIQVANEVLMLVCNKIINPSKGILQKESFKGKLKTPSNAFPWNWNTAVE